MKNKHFRLTPERRLEPSGTERSGIQDVSNDGVVWTQITDYDSTELSVFLDQASVPSGVVKACTEPILTTRIAVYGEWLLLTIPVSKVWNDPHRSFVMFVCHRDRMFTICDKVIPALENPSIPFTDGLRFHGHTTSAMLYQVIDFVIDENMVFTLKTREALEHVEVMLDGDPHEFGIAASDLRRHLSGLTATFEDQLYVIRTLQTIESDAFSNEGLREYFRDSITDLEHATRTVSRQESRLAIAQQEHQIRQQSRINSQLRILTIISTLFLPLMLITGVYGMNFRNMPELDWHYGYAGVLTVMGTLIVLMLLGFYRNHWFK